VGWPDRAPHDSRWAVVLSYQPARGSEVGPGLIPGATPRDPALAKVGQSTSQHRGLAPVRFFTQGASPYGVLQMRATPGNSWMN